MSKTMEHHARRFDDALAEFKRSLEARPRDNGPPSGPSGGPRIEPREGLGASPRGTNGVNAGRSNADKTRDYRIIAGSSVPAGSTWKIDPLIAVIVVLGVIIGFQQVGRRIDRNDKQPPELTRLLFAPGMTGERRL